MNDNEYSYKDKILDEMDEIMSIVEIIEDNMDLTDNQELYDKVVMNCATNIYLKMNMERMMENNNHHLNVISENIGIAVNNTKILSDQLINIDKNLVVGVNNTQVLSNQLLNIAENLVLTITNVGSIAEDLSIISPNISQMTLLLDECRQTLDSQLYSVNATLNNIDSNTYK